MKRTHAFRSRTNCRGSGEFIDVLVVFFGRAELDMNVLDDEIQDNLKTDDPLPDAVLLVSFDEHADRLIEVWKQNKTRADGLVRRGQRNAVDYLKELAIWKFHDGSFIKIFRDDQSRQSYDLDLAKLWRDGLAQLVDVRGAFQEAPPGHIFKHPSGRATRQFLLASELLRDEVDAYFVAVAVCITAWSRLKGTSTLHIDTMGIYPVARAVEDITRRCGGKVPTWEIDSFHSHGGMAGLHTVLTDSDAVLVSASTTGSMVAKLREDGVPEDALITLLDMSDDGRLGSVVYARNRYTEASRPQRSHNETVIELAGEYFAAQGKKPRPFVLTKAHQPASLQALLKHFSHRSVLRLNHARAENTARTDLVSLDEATVADNTELKAWLEDEVRFKTPASVSHILGLDGAGGQRMAQVCGQILQDIAGRPPKLVSLADLLALGDTTRTEVTGVLVCGAVVGDGHSLRAIARDLRELVPKASRHFVVAVGLPETMRAWLRLKQFLIQSGDKERPYLLSSWKVLPTGAPSGTGDAWRRAAELMQQADQMDITDHAPWPKEQSLASISEMAKALDSLRDGYLRTESGNVLQLTSGFVFWDPTDEIRAASNNAAVSFLAMSAALQNAREHQEVGSRLSSSMHEAVVLDVENFLRFNDGVLQASLLRAADAHELDYSGSPELSEMLREFLEKVFLNANRPYGEASLEFGLALATQRLRLTKTDSLELIDRIKNSLTQPSVLHGLIYVWWISIKGH